MLSDIVVERCIDNGNTGRKNDGDNANNNQGYG